MFRISSYEYSFLFSWLRFLLSSEKEELNFGQMLKKHQALVPMIIQNLKPAPDITELHNSVLDSQKMH